MRPCVIDPIRDTHFDAEARPLRLVQVRNPITRTWITLNPPFTVEGADEPEAFLARLAAYCTAAWDLARLDPQAITAPWPTVWEHPMAGIRRTLAARGLDEPRA